MSFEQYVLAGLMAFIAIANLLMNFARTTPSEATKNWGEWFDTLKKARYPELFDAIVRSRVWGVINAIGLIAGLVTFFYPTFWQDAVRSPRQMPGLVQQPAPVPQAPAPTSAPAPAEPRSAEDVATELSIWDSVNNNLRDLITVYNELSVVIDRWPDEVGRFIFEKV